jgi:uncharacterized protein YndB with AHSA1/START domain
MSADRVSRQVTVDVDAPPELVFDLVSDVTRMGEWSPESTGAQWRSGRPGEVGATFRGSNRRGRASWATTCEVVASERGRVFAFVVGNADEPSTVWRYDLLPLADGRTRVSESFQLSRPIGTASRLLTRLAMGVRDREADLEDGMHTTLQRLSAAACRDQHAIFPRT